MQISIVKIGNPGAFNARFYVDGKALHAQSHSCDSIGKSGKQAEWFTADAAALCFGQSSAALKWFEAAERLRVMGGTAVKRAVANGATQSVWYLDGELDAASARVLLQGALLAAYRFDSCKGGDASRPSPHKITVIAGNNLTLLKQEHKSLEAIDAGLRSARDLANTPANDLAPLQLAAYAKAMAAKHGLAYKQVDAPYLKKNGYIGLTAVGQGSENPPVLFTLEYKPARSSTKARPLCLVGKGITFDTGGISIKPTDGMWDMKADMGGAAAVVGAMQAIALLKPSVPVIAVVASAENMPDGKAYRPGDVLRFRNGRTVEIRSTDAEGRLVLADALIYAQETLKQKRIVDFATLTGACARALGTPFIGLMSRNAEFAQEVATAGNAAGDSCWELPLALEYRPLIDSSIADIMNSGGVLAGAQTAEIGRAHV